MLGLPPSVRIYFATEPTDMRKGIDGLRALVEGTLRHDPYHGHFFVFVGKSKDKVKILFCDRSDFVLYSTRLERGSSRCPPSTAVASRSRVSRCSSTGSTSTRAGSRG
jgi:transposase